MCRQHCRQCGCYSSRSTRPDAHSSRHAGRPNIHLARSTAGERADAGCRGRSAGNQHLSDILAAAASRAGYMATSAHVAERISCCLRVCPGPTKPPSPPTGVLGHILWPLVSQEDQAELHVCEVELGQQPAGVQMCGCADGRAGPQARLGVGSWRGGAWWQRAAVGALPLLRVSSSCCCCCCPLQADFAGGAHVMPSTRV